MARLRAAAVRLVGDRGGASGLEYCLLAAMIAAIIGVYYVTLGLPLRPIFNNVMAGLASG